MKNVKLTLIIMGFVAAIKLNKRGYALIGILVLVFLYFRFSVKPVNENEQLSLRDLLQTAVQAAETGGKLVVSARNDLEIQSKGKTKEGMEDSVTTADFLSHCAMTHIIMGTFPTVKFVSEEKDAACGESNNHIDSKKPSLDLPNVYVKASDVTVWIDPLDATHEYTEKLYQYVTTMVCVAIKGEPILGVIHNPFSGFTSWAVVGFGHSDDLVQPVKKSSSGKTKIIISRSHSGTIQDILERNFKNFEVIVAAGAGYKALQVANGTVDVYLHVTAIKKWDICAGDAILKALGGQMTTKRGQTLTYYDYADAVNSDGLIATLRNHDMFVDKL